MGSKKWETGLGGCLFCAFAADFTMGTVACVLASREHDYHTPLVFHVSDARGDAKIVSLPSEWNLAYVLGGAHLAGATWKLAVFSTFAVARWRTWKRGLKKNDDLRFDDLNDIPEKGGERNDGGGGGGGGSGGASFERSWGRFVASVENTTNYWRWAEWGLCGPMFALAASLCCGSRDAHFLLSQMLVAVSVVVLAFEQERKVEGTVASWSPATAAAGLFACQWTLVFWQAHASSTGTAVSAIPAVFMVVGVSIGFVVQTYASGGFRDGWKKLARVKDWVFGIPRKDGTTSVVTKNTDLARALRYECGWTGLVVSGKVCFTLIVLLGVVPDLPA